MPPEPILTRWGTWIDAAVYYAKHFDSIKEIVYSFDPNAAESIKITQKLFDEKEDVLKSDLAYIMSNFSFIPDAITKFESADFDLNDGILSYDEVQAKLYALRRPIYFRKFQEVIARNSNLNRLRIIRNALYGRNEENDEDDDDMEFMRQFSPAELSMFRNVPLSSCDVERSFSVYKTVLTPNRRSFHFDNLKHYLVICCNSRTLP